MSKGAVAAGDQQTANAAIEVLKAGGNAFDAVLAALFASTLAEPVLSSLGGGGFLMAKPANGSPMIYDFFAQTPMCKNNEVDFKPVVADFGTTTQEFHIGLGAVAMPGVVKGAFEIHRDLATMPISEIVAPACELASKGFQLSKLQAYILEIVHSIYSSTLSCRTQYASPNDQNQLIGAGEILRVPDAADFLEALAKEGDDLFYRGEIASRLAIDCEDQGGHLQRKDFENYDVIKRKPLSIDFEGARIYTNPPPSVGGILVGFALDLMANSQISKLTFDSPKYIERLAHVMDLTNQARIESGLNQHPQSGALKLLDKNFVEKYKQNILGQPAAHKGTTHISVMDAKGNAASLTVSNGEGSGYIASHTGVVLNNMLGEEDINPQGFHNWPENTRMSSMMAPSLIDGLDGQMVALGSGGSNRIRTALLQVMVCLMDFAMPLQDAVALPRVHFEKGVLNVEPGFSDDVIESLPKKFAQTKLWEQQNMFFGGVHAVQLNQNTGALDGAGDPRRGGIATII